MSSCSGIEGLVESLCPDVTDTSCSEEILLTKSKGLSQLSSVEPTPLPPPGQGQEINTIGNLVPSPKSNLLENPLHSESCSSPSFSDYLNSEDAPLNENLLPIPNANSYSSGFQNCSVPDLNRTVFTPINQLQENGHCRLFGVSLGKRPIVPVPPSIVISSNELSKPFPVTKNMSHSGGSSYNIAQRCIKVQKFGTLVGRTVDLMQFNNYSQLLGELDRMFALEGGLVDGSNVWDVIYIDEEGDIMKLGDSPWVEFRFVVRKMFIFLKDQIPMLSVSSWDFKSVSPIPYLGSMRRM